MLFNLVSWWIKQKVIFIFVSMPIEDSLSNSLWDSQLEPFLSWSANFSGNTEKYSSSSLGISSKSKTWGLKRKTFCSTAWEYTNGLIPDYNFLIDGLATSFRQEILMLESPYCFPHPKLEGGLGFRNLELLNKAAILKLAWNISMNDSSWSIFFCTRFKFSTSNDPKYVTHTTHLLYGLVLRMFSLVF